MSLTVRRVGPESADVVLGIVLDAFGSRPPLDPPADALLETEDSIATRLALGGGLLARVDGEPVGCLLLDTVGDTEYIRRFGVVKAARGHGISAALVRAALEAAVGRRWLKVVAREELPQTVAFWVRRGFVQTDRRMPYVELARPAPTVHQVETADAMRELGRALAAELEAGDLVVLSGDLGAGKTTMTQGMGAGLGVEGAVTSPSFVIAREHHPTGSGPALVHADAYRLGGVHELDDLDLDTPAADAVTVVEWGTGLAEGLSENRIEVRITLSTGVGADPLHGTDTALDAPRTVEIERIGPRWVLGAHGARVIW